MIAGHGKRVVQTGKHALVLMEHRAGLAVHHLARAHHVTAIGLADALVAEADAEDRNLTVQFSRDLDRAARLGWRAGTR